MKKDINLFDEEFIIEIAEYLMEESKFSEIQKKYEEAKTKIQKNNKKRIRIINEIRLKKVNEINEELESTKIELKKMKEEISNIYSKYCEIKGHSNVLVNESLTIDPKTFDYCNDHEYCMELTYKCSVCGQITKKIEYKPNMDTCTTQEYVENIPYEIYDDKSLSISGKSLRMIEIEIQELEKYINYLLSLKMRICELFGHDAEKISKKDMFKCKCCEKNMMYKEYISDHYNAKYKDIIPYYYSNSKEIPDCIMNDPKNTKEEHLKLPTYEEYQKKLVLKKEKEDKN